MDTFVADLSGRSGKVKVIENSFFIRSKSMMSARSLVRATSGPLLCPSLLL